jgi:hypothetical protein
LIQYQGDFLEIEIGFMDYCRNIDASNSHRHYCSFEYDCLVDNDYLLEPGNFGRLGIVIAHYDSVLKGRS